ncbi:conserved hypothetical protein [Aspergillus fumigatus A1163]|uniref:Uncharacterized protein n=1 Tax=Aspergillus fumigatus (strain CBS 144.89 / FGSC A1163 / CEA10) TaxID=451804 RepID=B0XUA1_ASPFC|nr:conserved hypothetical protein [Aspergillus fumigatus A1163]
MAPTWRYPVSRALRVTFSVISGGLHCHLQVRHGVSILNDDLLSYFNTRLINLTILASAADFHRRNYITGGLLLTPNPTTGISYPETIFRSRFPPRNSVNAIMSFLMGLAVGFT